MDIGYTKRFTLKADVVRLLVSALQLQVITFGVVNTAVHCEVRVRLRRQRRVHMHSEINKINGGEGGSRTPDLWVMRTT